MSKKKKNGKKKITVYSFKEYDRIGKEFLQETFNNKNILKEPDAYKRILKKIRNL